MSGVQGDMFPAVELGRVVAPGADWATNPVLVAVWGWAQRVPELIEAIGPPGDFGYGSRRGMALHDAINLYRKICGAKRDSCGVRVDAMLDAMARVERELRAVRWPRDVERRLGRLYVALDRLTEARAAIEEAREGGKDNDR